MFPEVEFFDVGTIQSIRNDDGSKLCRSTEDSQLRDDFGQRMAKLFDKIITDGWDAANLDQGGVGWSYRTYASSTVRT